MNEDNSSLDKKCRKTENNSYWGEEMFGYQLLKELFMKYVTYNRPK